MGSAFQHTPEPWHVAEKKAVRLDVAYFIRPVDDRNCDYGATLAATSEKDAHRIVACVNACAGLHTKVVQTIAAFGGMSQDTAVAAVLQEAAKTKAMLEALKARIKEEAFEAYWQASDDNRADRWSDTFDEDVRASFERYWQENNKAGA